MDNPWLKASWRFNRKQLGESLDNQTRQCAQINKSQIWFVSKLLYSGLNIKEVLYVNLAKTGQNDSSHLEVCCSHAG